MKKLTILAATLGSLFLNAAQAQPFDYPMGPAQCAERAFRIPGMIRKHSIDLCIGATNTAPLNCYLKVSNIDNGIVKAQAIELCAGSTSSLKTLACYSDAWSTGVYRAAAIKLCKSQR